MVLLSSKMAVWGENLASFWWPWHFLFHIWVCPRFRPILLYPPEISSILLSIALWSFYSLPPFSIPQFRYSCRHSLSSCSLLSSDFLILFSSFMSSHFFFIYLCHRPFSLRHFPFPWHIFDSFSLYYALVSSQSLSTCFLSQLDSLTSFT